jgi:hypothetical protein
MLNSDTPSATTIVMEAMATIHAMALDVFHYFYSQMTLILMGLFTTLNSTTGSAHTTAVAKNFGRSMY